MFLGMKYFVSAISDFIHYKMRDEVISPLPYINRWTWARANIFSRKRVMF